MNEEIDNDQLHDICSKLLKGFINWIEINDSKEKASILDNAFQFKTSILEQDKSTLQKNTSHHHRIYQKKKLMFSYYNGKIPFPN